MSKYHEVNKLCLKFFNCVFSENEIEEIKRINQEIELLGEEFFFDKTWIDASTFSDLKNEENYKKIIKNIFYCMFLSLRKPDCVAIRLFSFWIDYHSEEDPFFKKNIYNSKEKQINNIFQLIYFVNELISMSYLESLWKPNHLHELSRVARFQGDLFCLIKSKLKNKDFQFYPWRGNNNKYYEQFVSGSFIHYDLNYKEYVVNEQICFDPFEGDENEYKFIYFISFMQGAQCNYEEIKKEAKYYFIEILSSFSNRTSEVYSAIEESQLIFSNIKEFIDFSLNKFEDFSTYDYDKSKILDIFQELVAEAKYEK